MHIALKIIKKLFQNPPKIIKNLHQIASKSILQRLLWAPLMRPLASFFFWGGTPKIIDFHRKLAVLEARFWGTFWNPFRFMTSSRVALDGKLTILGGSGCRVFFWRDFVLFLEGFWAVKTVILHERGSKNQNFTEVRIRSLFDTILEVILEPKSP